jgi:hypothetical protein
MPDDPPSSATASLAPQLLQACWRHLLNGNPHWVAYPRRDGRHKQCSVGHITLRGTDYTNYAGLPYLFTSELVDEYHLGFGFWSRSWQGLYRWAAHDIETGAHGRSTTAVQAYDDALRAYQTYLRATESQGNALVTLLEESSPGHYHVWTIFKEAIYWDEHNVFIRTVEQQTGNLLCLDKTTARARRGLGDQFRAPGSWKNDARSTILDYHLPDGDILLALAEACPPALCPDPEQRLLELITGRLRAGKYEHKTFKTPRTSIQSLVKEMIARYPITGPGQRNDTTARVTLCLMNRNLNGAEVTEVLFGWLEHYAPLMRTPLETAKREAIRCRDRTYRRLDEGTIAPPQSHIDHWFLIDHHQQVLPCFHFPWRPRAIETPPEQLVIPADTVPTLCPPLHGEEEEKEEEDSRWKGLRGPITPSERPYVQALLLLVLHKVLNTEERVFQLVDEQWLEAAERITGKRPDWRQLQRIKDRFITRKKGTRTIRAVKWELLRETRKGRIGLPSQYRLSGIAIVLQQVDAISLSETLWRLTAYPPADMLEEAREGGFLTSEDGGDAQDGPWASHVDDEPRRADETQEEPVAKKQ